MFDRSSRRLRIWMSTVALLALVGCGGGGGSSTSATGEAVDTPTSTVGSELVKEHGSSCALGDQEVLFPVSGGFTVSPRDPDTIIYARPDRAGKYQVHRHTVSTGTDVCLTCNDVASGPAAVLNKGAPSFIADGSAFVLQVESTRNPNPALLGGPGAGWYNNVWIAASDGSRWRQLTDLPMSTTVAAGVLQPHVSPDGSRITFAQLVAADPQAQAQYAAGEVVLNSNPFGIWRLTTGLFAPNSVAGSIGPSVSQRPAPPGATTGQFFEVSGWSPDSRTILYASDVGKDHVHKLDLWRYDVVTGALVNLTDSDDFDEFGDFSPDGRRIVYMSSAGTGWNATSPSSIPFGRLLSTELHLMHADGRGKVKLTDINGAGMPPSLRSVGAARGIVAKMAWSSDGRSVYFELAFFAATKGDTPGRALGSILVRQNFRGACGRQ